MQDSNDKKTAVKVPDLPQVENLETERNLLEQDDKPAEDKAPE